MTLRILVVGGGFGSRVVAPVFAATDGCAVVDVVSARDDVHSAVREHRPDLVSVHSPPFLHAGHVRAAIEAGAAVLCDKPCTSSAAETAALLQDVASAGVPHFANFEFRYEPARVEIGRILQSGAIGTARECSWLHHSAGSRHPLRPYGWLFDSTLGGGWIGAWASHAVDALRVWFGDPLEVVSSRPRTDIPQRPDEDGLPHDCSAEDGLLATLRTGGGIEVRLDSTFAAQTNDPPRITIVGTDGRIDNTADDMLNTRTKHGESTLDFRDGERGDRHLRAMRRWAEVVRDSVLGGAALPGAPTLHDGLACDRVLDALRAG